MNQLRDTIETAFANRQTLSANNASDTVKKSVQDVLNQLDDGLLRVAEPVNHEWVVHEWIKKAVLLSFCLNDSKPMSDGCANYYDKVPLKFSAFSEVDWQSTGVRVVPQAIARHGAYIGANTVLMPSYVNIGAYIDEGCMIDTWATVGSCAQLGKNVHLSGGAGIGGVLEPLQATPTIIEDNCFIGARSEVVEGVIVGEGAVIGMGVFLGQSTKIYNRQTGDISYGKVPPGSVVVPGSLPSQDGTHSLACAVIVKQVDAKTRAKISINELLRT